MSLPCRFAIGAGINFVQHMDNLMPEMSGIGGWGALSRAIPVDPHHLDLTPKWAGFLDAGIRHWHDMPGQNSGFTPSPHRSIKPLL